jgi:peptidoglycan-associated lipoprotein
VKTRFHLGRAARLLWVLSVQAGSISSAEEGAGQAAANLEWVHQDRMGGTFAIGSAEYHLDGKQLLHLTGKELRERLSSSPQLLRIPLPLGLHVISLRIVYVGRSGLFSYVERYRFSMQGYLLIESRAGYDIKVISTGEERNPLSAKWENRPSFRLAALPQEVVRAVHVGPIERGQIKTDDPEQNLKPLAIKITEPHAKLLEDYLADHAAPAVASAQVPSQVRIVTLACDTVPVSFAVGQSRLTRSARRDLERLSACLLRAPDKRMQVEGHCDQRGSDALNDRLGHARATAIRNFLILRGVQPQRLEAISFGKRRPICADGTAHCHETNRKSNLIELSRAD